MLSSLCIRDIDTPYYEEETKPINSFYGGNLYEKIV